MADRIAVLGEATEVAIGTATVYTVPVGKAARVKLFYRGLATASAPDFSIKVNGLTIMEKTVTANNHFFSSTVAMHDELAAAPTGETAATTVAPAAAEYFLSPGDTVQYVVASNALSSMFFQVVGVEVDVT